MCAGKLNFCIYITYGYVTIQLNLLYGQGQTVQGTGALLGLQIGTPPDFRATAGSEIKHPPH